MAETASQRQWLQIITDCRRSQNMGQQTKENIQTKYL